MIVRRDSLVEILTQNPGSFRLFTGYSGWGGGQLDCEIEAGGWMTCPARYEYVFTDKPDELWHRVAQDIGADVLTTALKMPELPRDIHLN